MDGSIIGETEKAWKIGVYGEESFWAAKSKCKETGDAIIIPAWMAEQNINIKEEVCCLLGHGEAIEKASGRGKPEDKSQIPQSAPPVSGGNGAGKTSSPGDFRNTKPDEEVTILADRMQVCIREARRIVEAELDRDGLSKDRECEVIQSIGVSLFIQIGRRY